ncbi:MAG: GFA family protein [Burkholderiaceae bacterium]
MSSDSSIGAAHRGRCLCGSIHFLVQTDPIWVAHCHCDSCRRATSSAMTTYAGFLKTDVRFIGETRGVYPSSPGVERSFCTRCGSPLSFASTQWPDEIHLFVASFETPGQFVPNAHVHVGEQLPWLHLGDGLPRYFTTSDEGPPLA